MNNAHGYLNYFFLLPLLKRELASRAQGDALALGQRKICNNYKVFLVFLLMLLSWYKSGFVCYLRRRDPLHQLELRLRLRLGNELRLS